MTTPSTGYALPATRPVPPGVRPGPVSLPVSPDAPTTPPDTPAPPQPSPPPPAPAEYLFPGSTARQLRILLAERGVERTYHSAHANMAVVSLPGVTVWISPRDLSWTHASQPATWPATDLPGAADHLATLATPAALPVPAGVPWEDAQR